MTEYAELQTIRDFIRFAVSRFNQANLYFGHGTDNAWDEAVFLVLHTLHLPHTLNPHFLDAQLTHAEREKILILLDKRVIEHIPVPYLTKQAWFAGLSFYVDERVLIPRSPIAELIENHFQPWINPESVENILDLCTGSGCIAIACAENFPEATVDATDISADALAVAKINVLRYHAEAQIHLWQSDVFDTIPPKKYDIIVSNPPYVDAEDMATLPPEYHHEPHAGLAAGIDGLAIVTRILSAAKHFLAPHGILVVEVGNSETKLTETFPEVPLTWVDFQRGDGGVFLLTAEQCAKYF